MPVKPTYSIDAPDQQRLKVARVEIEAILKKHDLAGVVVLHTPGMTEFFYDIRPSYSCAWIDEAAGALRMRAKLADYNGDRLRQRHDITSTANMMEAIADNMRSAAGMFGQCADLCNRAARAEHLPGVLTPDPMEAKKQ